MAEKEKKEKKKTREISLRRENPFSLFQDLDRTFAELWNDDFFFPYGRRRKRQEMVPVEDRPFFRTPLANIQEEKNNFIITAEMPGLDKGDIEITVQAGNLEIKGEMKEEKKEEKKGEVIRREYKSSSYYRAFSLPENIDANNIEATLEKGMLHLKIPKVIPPEPEKKKIDVK